LWYIFIINSVEQLQTLPKTQSEIDISPFLKTQVEEGLCAFEVLLFCVWCLDNWSRILSGKSFNTFSMARLKTLQFHLTLTPLFTATHTLFFLSFTIFFSWSVIGVFGLFSCEPRFMAHIDTPWFVKFSKMANINFCESWFGFFLN
jgi:hypothetical protein